MQEMQIWSQGWKDPLEWDMAAHSNFLAWNIPWTGEPGGLQLMGSQRVGHNWVIEYPCIENTDKKIKEDSNPHNPIILDKVSSCYFCFLCLAVHSVQFSSVAQSCPTLCDPMNCSTPGLPVHHQLLELTQTHVHRVSDAIHPSHPLSSPSPPAPNPSQLSVGEVNGNPLQYACLENSMDRGAWWAIVQGVTKGHEWETNTFTLSYPYLSLCISI